MVEGIGVPGENHWPFDKLYHNVSGIGTDCIGSCKSNYHMIRTTTAPTKNGWLWYHDIVSNSFFYSLVWSICFENKGGFQ